MSPVEYFLKYGKMKEHQDNNPPVRSVKVNPVTDKAGDGKGKESKDHSLRQRSSTYAAGDRKMSTTTTV